VNDSNSQSRFVFFLNGGAVSWKTYKHVTVANSMMKDEYITAFEAAKEVVLDKKFCF
jgi:hypothetical protein